MKLKSKQRGPTNDLRSSVYVIPSVHGSPGSINRLIHSTRRSREVTRLCGWIKSTIGYGRVFEPNGATTGIWLSRCSIRCVVVALTSNPAAFDHSWGNYVFPVASYASIASLYIEHWISNGHGQNLQQVCWSSVLANINSKLDEYLICILNEFISNRIL